MKIIYFFSEMFQLYFIKNVIYVNMISIFLNFVFYRLFLVDNGKFLLLASRYFYDSKRYPETKKTKTHGSHRKINMSASFRP